jgi:hypothetical protein
MNDAAIEDMLPFVIGLSWDLIGTSCRGKTGGSGRGPIRPCE